MVDRFFNWLFDMDGMGVGCLFRMMGLLCLLIFIIMAIVIYIMKH